MHLIYKELHLHINLYIQKQHVFYCAMTIYILFIVCRSNLKSINQEYLLFLKLLKKHSIEYLTIEL